MQSSEQASPSQLRDKVVRLADAVSAQAMDKVVGQADVPKELDMFSEMESNVEFNSKKLPVCNLDKHPVNENTDGLPEQFRDGNASIPSMDANSRQTEESDKNIGDSMNTNENESNPSVDDKEGRGDASTREKIIPEQQEVGAAKLKRGKRVAWGKRIRDAHPMTKSLAEAGTSFETGVRRSKRVRMRPLEYWKGERFLYGRVEDGLKLIGLKYISPGKGNDSLKVKPYILSDKYKDVLDLAARH
ncbi:centromere protein C-like [Salvia splendens]|uniref:centromere protein C-like n=1 Tax=Salvia splendens TaxID=180675 RepID=UPI001C25E7DE|nr:centromere protein C-like [Salvia splendens]